MDKLPYQVFSPSGQLVLQAAENCRSSRQIELDQLAAGYTILLHGKKIMRKEVCMNDCRRSNKSYSEPHGSL